MNKYYKCKICDKEVQLLKRHLKNQHNEYTIDSYLKTYNEKENYNNYMEISKIQRQKRSPNSIHFYIEKGYSEEEAKIELDNYNKKNPWRRLDVSPAQPLYWIKKGYSEEEAKQKSYLHNSHSLDNLIIKFGEEIGTKKYRSIQESFKGRKNKIINSLSKKYNCSIDDAILLYNEQMRLKSPKTIEYWLNKGYTKEQALDIIKKKGQNESPRHINYWLRKCNNDYNMAKCLHMDFQDNISIGAIIKKYNCTEDAAINKQNMFIEKMLNTMKERGYIYKHTKSNFLEYTQKVRNISEKTYRRYKHIIDPDNLRGKEYHLDHKYSIFQGFIDNIDEDVIGSLFNLEIIPAHNNQIKYKKCSITNEQLLNNYKNK